MPIDSKRDLLGKTPGISFADQDYSIKIAMVQRVDEVNFKADLKILSGMASTRLEISLTQGMFGPRSFWGGIPEVGSLVLIGYRRIQNKVHEASILGYLPTALRTSWRFDPVSPDDPGNIDPATSDEVRKQFGDTTRFKRLYLRPGDVGGMSAAGAEFTLSKDVRFTNRAGDFLELRDSERSLISSSVHRIDNAAGVRGLAGPIRRSAFFLPEDIFETGNTLKSVDSTYPYYGQDELQLAGPGATAGEAPKFSNTQGVVLDLFNNFTEFPSVTYSNGRKVHYPPTARGVSIDDPDNFASAFVEQRVELSHTTDLVQEVLEEIDGFSMDRRLPYIEQVLGTVVGNSLNSTRDQRQYGQILKPILFREFTSNSRGKFSLEAVDRSPTKPDREVNTQAAAYLFRVRAPEGIQGSEDPFAYAVSKQGKFYLSVPGSTDESYAGGDKNISGEVSLGGALKAYIGASTPDRISVHATMAGGVHLDIGRDSQGNAVTIKYHSGIKTIADGNPNDDDVATDEEIRGTKRSRITGREQTLIEGSRLATASGMYKTEADRYNLNAISGASINAGEMNMLISGKTQLNYALQVLETIALGGRVNTILAGGDTQTILAGAKTTTVTAGATAFNNPAGAFAITVGTGSLSATVATGAITLSTAAGAISISAAAGAVAITAGLALNLTAATVMSLASPLIQLGGPSAVLGVCRAIPSLPPGTPTLDPITGVPLLGSATVLAN